MREIQIATCVLKKLLLKFLEEIKMDLFIKWIISMVIALSTLAPLQASQTQPCVFCDIVSGKSPSFKVWESQTHLAFLSIFPNTKGTTVVIPKQHHDSYAFSLREEDLCALTLAAKEVALLLDQKLPGVGRTGMVFEGFGINHVHAKLFPLHGTATEGEWKPIKSSVRKYFEIYEGYISSHDGERGDDGELAELAEYIRKC